ncbi:Type-1 restriction enzyme EcoKI specificity protein [Methanosarcinales archaeon]|nr:Type-1 restriction enzyme EcoKI specificity protein [Methanosarcinales archaeon]
MKSNALPEGGKIKKISELIINQLSGFACAIDTMVERDGYVQLRPFNFGDNGRLKLDTLYQIPIDQVDTNIYSLKKGDILFNNTNSIELVGKSLLVDKEYPFAFSNHINRLRVDTNSVIPAYFQYHLRYMWIKEHFAFNCKKWIGQAGYTVNKLAEQMIFLPSLENQQKIVEKLDNQMAQIETMKKESEKQKEISNNLRDSFLIEMYQKYSIFLTSFDEFISESCNGFGERPNGVEAGPIVLRIADVSSGQVDYSNARRGNVAWELQQKYKLNSDDLIFIRVNGSMDFIGKCILFNDEINEPVLFNDHLIRIRVNDEFIPEFVKIWCETPFIRRYMADKASTSAGQLTINRSVLNEMPIPKVDKSIQKIVIEYYKRLNSEFKQLNSMIYFQFNAINQLPASILNEVFGQYQINS